MGLTGRKLAPNQVKSKKVKVKSNSLMRENDLKERLFQFAIGVLKMLGTLKGGREIDVIKYQLSKSATSSGANYEESQAAVSKADFINKVGIALKEMRESNYWLRIIKELFPKTENIVYLTGESEELGKILASILIKSRT
jgi:four helix bundle protein